MLEQDHQRDVGEAPADPRARGSASRAYKWAVDFLKHHMKLVIALATLALISEEVSKSIIIDSVRDIWRKQPTKIVLAVFPDTPTARPMADGLGFNDSRSPIDLKEGWRLEYMAESGTPEATDLALRKRLEDNNVVLVVGHDSSSTVKYLLTHVYGDKEIPLILPAVTNPDLTTVLQKSPTHILRLPPVDNVQVDTLRQLLGNLRPSSVVLVVDNSNFTYSNFIATQLVETGKTIPFIDSVGVGLGDRGFEPRLFLSSNPDVLVFIGMEVQADIFLRRLRHEFDNSKATRPLQLLKVPTLVFTDGVAGELFDDAAKGLLESDAKIYVACPLPTLKLKGQMLDRFPTYKSYASAALEIIRQIIAEVDGERIDRTAIRKEMTKMMHAKNNYAEFGELRVKFDEHGNNVQGVVHVFEVTKDGVLHSKLCPCI